MPDDSADVLDVLAGGSASAEVVGCSDAEGHATGGDDNDDGQYDEASEAGASSDEGDVQGHTGIA
eukprot:11165694-Lingulodinium_polyedra.AAC.1